MKDALGILVRWSGLAWSLRKICARRRVTMVVYHAPDPETLRAHLTYYARHYSFTTLNAVADALENGRWETLPPYPLVVTIDDGHRSNAELEPLFRAFGVRPTIYLCSRIVGTARPFWWTTGAARRIGTDTLKRVPDGERRFRLAQAGDDPERETETRQALSWQEVSRLTAVCDFGAHTRSHPILTCCDDKQAAEEIGLCRIELEEATGLHCRHFAYPNGDYSDRDVAMLRQAGYRTARTIDPGWNGPTVDPMRLKCFAISDNAPVSWLAVQLTGLPAVARGLRKRLRRPVLPAPAASPAPAAETLGRPRQEA